MKSVFQGINAAQFNIQPRVKGGPRPHLCSIVCCSQRLGLDWGVLLEREFRGSLGSWGGRSPIRSVLQVSECLTLHSVSKALGYIQIWWSRNWHYYQSLTQKELYCLIFLSKH